MPEKKLSFELRGLLVKPNAIDKNLPIIGEKPVTNDRGIAEVTAYLRGARVRIRRVQSI